MAKPYRVAEAQIFAKVEATPGTAEVPVANDMFLAQNVSFTPNIANNSNDSMSSVPDREVGSSGSISATLSYDIVLKGSGVAGTAPEWRDSFMACGQSETIVGGTSVTYKPAAAESYWTFACIYPGLGAAGEDIQFRMTGCQGTGKLSWKAGGLLIGSFTMTGAWVAPADITLVSVPTWDTSVPYAFLAAGMQFQGTSGLTFETFEYDLGNSVEMRPSANGTFGFYTAQITARRPVGSVDFEQEKLATFNLWSKIASNTTGAIAMTALGTAGNLLQLSIPKMRFTGAASGARAGVLLSTSQYEALRNSNAGLDTHSLILT